VSESIILADAAATEAAGSDLAGLINERSPEFLCICLEGELGAGKTTFARGFMRGFGHTGRVPSPTYTLVEPYQCGAYTVCHMDLYRLQDGAELEYLGISEMTGPGHILLIEWPSKAADSIPNKDLQVNLDVCSAGRSLTLQAATPLGEILATAFSANHPSISH
jgi:tRNA threonylcarbamoyladenosine biosynthesis protein TsaE